MSGLLDICLHGQVDTAISYHATIAGADLWVPFLPRGDRRGGAGDALLLRRERDRSGTAGVSYRGNGGAFCEYMFGVEQSLTDLMRPDVKNRLVIFGAYFAPILKRIIFTDRTDGIDSYDQIFLNGNALVNYYFFVQWNVGGGFATSRRSFFAASGAFSSGRRASSMETTRRWPRRSSRRSAIRGLSSSSSA